MNGVLKTILERRSTRSFDAEKKVSEADIYDVLKAGAFAPSAMNAQSWHFTVITNAEKLRRLNDTLKFSMGASQSERDVARSKDENYNFYYHAPVLIIVSAGEGALYPREDCACALENMFIYATSAGLGSCWINQLSNGADERASVRQLLSEYGVPEKNKVYGCCALGYHDKTTPLKDRAKNTVNFCK